MDRAGGVVPERALQISDELGRQPGREIQREWCVGVGVGVGSGVGGLGGAGVERGHGGCPRGRRGAVAIADPDAFRTPSLPVICRSVSDIRHGSLAPTLVQRHTAGEVIDRHRHDIHQLLYVSTGMAAVRTERGSYVAAPDRALWIPAGVWHEHRFYGETAFHSIGFAVDDALLAADEPVVLSVGPLFREVVVACAVEELNPTVGAHLRAVLRDALSAAPVQPLPLPHARDPRLAAACAVVLADRASPHPMAALAQAGGTSERALSRLFRAEFGTTYPQWRARARAFQAMIELAEGASVTQAGSRCGWATTSAFIASFTQMMGLTPGAYRAAATAG